MQAPKPGPVRGRQRRARGGLWAAPERRLAAAEALARQEEVARVPGLRIMGTARDKASVVSFTMDDIHPHDLGTILDRKGVAVRAGHHCAMPVMQFYGVPATVRASMAFYNTREEIDRLRDALLYAHEVFA